MAGVQRLIEEFDSRHVMYGNKEYADLLWQVRQCSNYQETGDQCDHSASD